MTPSPCSPRDHRAAGRSGPTDPPRPGARARRGPGGVGQGLARPAGVARPRPVRCLDPPHHRSFLPRVPAATSPSGDRGRIDSSRPTFPSATSAPSSSIATRWNGRSGVSIRTGERSSSSTTSSGCPCRKRRRRSGSRSGRPSLGCIDRLRRCGSSSMPNRARKASSFPRAYRMSAFDRSGRLQQELPDLLTDIAAPQVPDYADDLLARTAVTRQRPRWTFLERWLPMGVIARRCSLPDRSVAHDRRGRRPGRARGGRIVRRWAPSGGSRHRSARLATARWCSTRGDIDVRDSSTGLRTLDRRTRRRLRGRIYP